MSFLDGVVPHPSLLNRRHNCQCHGCGKDGYFIMKETVDHGVKPVSQAKAMGNGWSSPIVSREARRHKL